MSSSSSSNELRSAAAKTTDDQWKLDEVSMDRDGINTPQSVNFPEKRLRGLLGVRTSNRTYLKYLARRERTHSLNINNNEEEATPTASTLQLGAAPRIESPTDSLFPKMREGRGELALTLTLSTENWPIAKWAKHLNLRPFNPKNELELEEWFADASLKITSNAATAKVVIQSMQLTAPEMIIPILGGLLDKASMYRNVEDIADDIARRIFRGDYILETCERDLLMNQEKKTVFEAFAEYRKLEETYFYLCRRRNRYQILGPQQAASLAMRLIPRDITSAIRRVYPMRKWDALDLFTHAADMEEAVRRERDELNPISYAVEPMDTTTNAAPKQPPVCGGCLGPHFRKLCPFKQAKCFQCNKIGHIGQACRNHVVYDTAGRRRLITRPKQSGVVMEAELDNTNPAQLQTVAGVVNKLINTSEKEKQRAREKYAEKRLADHKGPVRTRPERQVLTAAQSQGERATDLEEEEEVYDESYSSEDEGEARSSYVATTIRESLTNPARKRLMEVNIKLNSTPTVASLDTGALVNIMSDKTASKLNIKIDENKSGISIKNVHQEVKRVSLSERVLITVDHKNVVNTRFAILPEDIVTLVSLPTMQLLGLKICPRSNTVECEGIEYQCNVVQKGTETKQQAVPTTLQQSIIESIEESVNKKAEGWSKNLTDIEVTQGKDLLREFKDLWQEPKAGRCTTVTMHLEVKGTPKRIRARPIPVHLRQEMNKQIEDLLAAKVIEPAPDSEWVSACHLVPKPRSDKWRLVIDYRYVNSVLQDDGYQVPHIQDLLIKLTGAKLFSLIDLNWGFWNVALDEASKQYTGFAVPGRGVYAWNVMPFGLKTSPTTFQRAIEKALRSLIDEDGVSVYIDDIMVYSRSVSDHMKKLKAVFIKLRESGFYINFGKAQFLKEELLYLGHIVGYNTLKPDPAKIQGIKQAGAPADKKTLLSFCAAANFLRTYIPNFSEVMSPLTSLTGKHTKFKWSQEQQEAFETAKEAIINACYLTMPTWGLPFIIFADASETAVGAALAQLTTDPERIEFIAFGSKKLTETQRNWSPTERELFAIIWACEHYDNIIKGSKILVFSDHQSLEHLTTTNSPKLRRWAIRLSEYQPYVTHIGGENNNIADWLSRSLPETDEESRISEPIYVPVAYHLVHEVNESYQLPTSEEISIEAKREEAMLPPGTLDWQGDRAYGRRSRRLYIPEKYRQRIMLWFHASRFGGHQGIIRTTNRMRKYVWWNGMHKSVEQFINSCPICNVLKPEKHTGGHKGALSAPQLFQLISMDYVGPRTYKGKRFYMLVIIDHYSRYMTTIVTSTTEAPTTENALRDHWVSKFGIPSVVLVDKGGAFIAKSFKAYVEKALRSKLLYTSTEYPQGNGINESAHRILEMAIKTTIPTDTETIEDVVSNAVLLYNVTPNRVIGDTPASLIFGMDLHLPGLDELREPLTEEGRLTRFVEARGTQRLLQQLHAMAEFEPVRSDKSKNIPFKVGDIVTYRLPASERVHGEHISKEPKYAATRSLPQRITKVFPHTVLVVPLWTKGKGRSVPKEDCKLIATFIPDLLRERSKQLFPKFNWNPPDEAETATTVPAGSVDHPSNPNRTDPTQERQRKRVRREVGPPR